MEAVHTYSEDLLIAQSIIRRDGITTRRYLYQQCYPLFKSIFDNYHTDCTSCREFIDEIYLLILQPSKQSGRCQLENYRGESTLTSWLKTVCLFYCYHKHDRLERMPHFEPFNGSDEKSEDEGDRNDNIYGSIETDFRDLDREDVDQLLQLMPNERYRQLIRLRYIDHLSHEETAEALEMTMENYYNVHKRAKEQYCKVYRKEERCYEG